MYSSLLLKKTLPLSTPSKIWIVTSAIVHHPDLEKPSASVIGAYNTTQKTGSSYKNRGHYRLCVQI